MDGSSAFAACIHCGLPTAGGRFCCAGCQAAHDLIQGLGLGGYYLKRALDPAQRPIQPDPQPHADLMRFIETDARGIHTLHLAVEGIQCGACVWLIEAVLARDPAVCTARVNMTTRRLRLSWAGEPSIADTLCAIVEGLGYHVVPFQTPPDTAADAQNRGLIRAMAVAGFAAGNVMLLSLGTWFGATQNMGPVTLALMHWLSALIAIPAVIYASRPFTRSAWKALRHGGTNMDVPVSVGVILVVSLSLWQTAAGSAHVYFDSACTLLFFLLIGRVLDSRARAQTRQTAARLLLLRGVDICVVQADGATRRMSQNQISPGDIVLVGMGERIGVDGVLASAAAQIDTSVVTGESLPENIVQGGHIFAGSINMGAPLTVIVTATGEGTLLAECLRLIEAAEQARGRFVLLADRIARLYTPVVHVAALAVFLVWWAVLGRAISESLMVAVSVLIITCPCALALAIPAVQVVATSRLFRAGILLKSPTALERLAKVDTVVFDKTGTLTEPSLALAGNADEAALTIAAGMAASSRHPLCRALVEAAGPVAALLGVVEVPGQGLEWGGVRLGSRTFCSLPPGLPAGPELCLARPDQRPAIFAYAEMLRADAPETIRRLRAGGYAVEISSGDQQASVARIAAVLGVQDAASRQSPVQKAARIDALAALGRHVLMVGDGLNDSPCLAAALVSAAPASAADISQSVADVVYQGNGLAPVARVLSVARRARRIMWQNLMLSIGYNVVMLPLAACGYVTPWIAALAMSSSSIIVISNSLRLQGGRP